MCRRLRAVLAATVFHFGTLRIAILLAVLVFVALGAWLDKRRSTDWDSTLRVTVYPIAAGTDPATTGYLASLGGREADMLAEVLACSAVGSPETVRGQLREFAHGYERIVQVAQ